MCAQAGLLVWVGEHPGVLADRGPQARNGESTCSETRHATQHAIAPTQICLL
jgi:hypothetical protein